MGYRLSLPILLMYTVILSLQVFSILAIQQQFPAIGDIKQILQSLDRIVSFYESSVEQANIDGVYGLRIVEGSLNDIKQSSIFEYMNSDIKYKISDIHQRCTEPIKKGTIVVEKNDPEKFKMLRPFIARTYTAQPIPRLVKAELRWQSLVDLKESFKVFNEDASDSCFGALFAAADSETCTITTECTKLLTTHGLRSYPLTHQILFSMEAEKIESCSRAWDIRLRHAGYIDNVEYQREWCTNSYYEMISLVHMHRSRTGDNSHSVHHDYIDLFYEHLFVCPSIGFYEFLKKEFLPIILNAQDSSGCFKSQEFIGQPGKRKLLEEEEAEDGCLFHLTAVAAGALTTYLKYGITLTYQSEKYNLDLLYDNKHYQLASEAAKLQPRLVKNNEGHNYQFYIAVMLINILFIYCFVRRKYGLPLVLRRFV